MNDGILCGRPAPPPPPAIGCESVCQNGFCKSENKAQGRLLQASPAPPSCPAPSPRCKIWFQKKKLSPKTFAQNFRTKLSHKTFAQNFGTQTLNNFYKP